MRIVKYTPEYQGQIIGTVAFSRKEKYAIRLLESFNKKDLSNSLYHPRLNQPMRIIDLMYFLAEHDEHHLNHILKIRNSQVHY